MIRWKRPNGVERSNTAISFCNRCNGSGHHASDCRCSKLMVCVDCKGTRHKDRYSGYCSWNTTNFTLPVDERTPDNQKIKRPTQENAVGTQPQRSNKYVDSCACTVNHFIDKILHNQDSAAEAKKQQPFKMHRAGQRRRRETSYNTGRTRKI